jgi:hypothetical protein
MWGRVSVAILVAVSLLSGPAASAAGPCERDEAWGDIRVAFVLEVVRLTNEHRAGIGVAPLSSSRSLTRAALWKAAHMAAYGYLDHDDPAPPVARTWDQRVEDCGYGSGAGENIASGYPTPQAAFNGWLGSEGHRENIESPGYSALGVGVAMSADGTPYWVQVFGTVDDSSNDAHSAPTATADAIELDEDSAPLLDLTANDSDVDGDPIEVAAIATQPSHGVAMIQGGMARYRPEPNFNGTDSFGYTVVDVFGYSSSERVEVSIEPVNDPPRAVDDGIRARPRRTVSVDVLVNDDDVEGDALSVTRIVSGPSRGAASIDRAGGSVTYRARRRTAGTTDRFVYEVADGDGAMSRATVTVSIRRR